MSEERDYEVGYGRPPKEHQFKKGERSNSKGRPPKRLKLLVDSEFRRILLEVLDEEMEINTPKGRRKITKFEGIIRNLVTNAANSKPTALIQLMKVLPDALKARADAHMQVMTADYLRTEQEKPVPPDGLDRKTVKQHIKATKGKY